MSLTPTPEFARLNRARKQEGLPPLASDDALNETLADAGFTQCEGKSYPWARRA